MNQVLAAGCPIYPETPRGRPHVSRLNARSEGASEMDEQAGTVPPVLYVPARHEVGRDELDLELSTLTDGRVAALAYTSLDRLVEACGAGQPLALLPSDQLIELQAAGAFAVIALDTQVPVGLRKDAGRD